ncbi:MAG: hypothetical protein KDE19_01505 [Caldilineaceae bacterium]|nr:hypothetical protein [Caldilineaceae bacterium]
MRSVHSQPWFRALYLFAILGTIGYTVPGPLAWAAGNYVGCGGETVAVQNADFEAAVVELVNQRRAEANLPPLKWVTEASSAARYHAADMAEDDYFDHNSYDRNNDQVVQVCGWADRIRGYYTGASALGENIAAGYRTPASVMEGWMNSPGHRGNILGNYAEIGVGFYNYRWVQDFGTRNSVAAMILNREARETDSPEVSIYLHGTGSQLRLRNDDEQWSEWQPFQNEFTWTVPHVAGEHRVDIEVQRGQSVVTGSDTIVVSSSAAATPTPTIVPTATPLPTPTLTPGSPQGFSYHTYLPLVSR